MLKKIEHIFKVGGVAGAVISSGITILGAISDLREDNKKDGLEDRVAALEKALEAMQKGANNEA